MGPFVTSYRKGKRVRRSSEGLQSSDTTSRSRGLGSSRTGMLPGCKLSHPESHPKRSDTSLGFPSRTPPTPKHSRPWPLCSLGSPGLLCCSWTTLPALCAGALPLATLRAPGPTGDKDYRENDPWPLEARVVFPRDNPFPGTGIQQPRHPKTRPKAERPGCHLLCQTQGG